MPCILAGSELHLWRSEAAEKRANATIQVMNQAENNIAPKF